MCVEVETRTLEEVDEVVGILKAAGACKGAAATNPPTTHVTRVMLDNMVVRLPGAGAGVDVSLLKEAVSRVGSLAETEASGNVTLTSIATIAATGVDFVSVGALTHSVIALDISLKIVTM